MPKEIRTTRLAYAPIAAPYPTPTTANSFTNRTTAIWSTADDERLLQARAAESSWQLVAEKYFPGKTANACRKRYERLVEKRNVEDWDAQKRGQLAQEYLKMRKEIWEPLAVKMGIKWTVAEAKVCLLHGSPTLQIADPSSSAWAWASNNFKPPPAQLTAKKPPVPAQQSTRAKVSPTTTATPA